MLNFILDNFSGPLELLLCLVQKGEISITDIPIHELTTQFLSAIELEANMDMSCEALSLSATLLLAKSQKLLPKDEHQEVEIDSDSRVEIIQHLLDYCHLREAAKNLSQREASQMAHFPRQAEPRKKELQTGLQEINIEGLQTIFSELIAKAEALPKKVLWNEQWHVADKLSWLRKRLRNSSPIPFEEMFHVEMCKGELIVSFLALLELMKHQEIRILKKEASIYIISYGSQDESRT